MSWAALNYVRRLKKETGIVGNVRLVLLMIAWRIPKGYTESRPIQMRALVHDTCLDKKTIRECVRKAAATGYVRIKEVCRGRGGFTTYEMPNLAGPLFMAGEDACQGEEKGGEIPPFEDQRKGGDSPPIQAVEKGGDSPPFRSEKGESRPLSVRTSALRDVRTKKTTTALTKPAAAAIYVSACEYLDWFAATYPQHHNGAKVSIDIEVDGPVVVELLTVPPRSLGQLKAMALAMWTVTSAEDAWLPRATDRGIRLLRHAADRLDAIAATRSKPRTSNLGPCRFKHSPPCTSAVACSELERRLTAEREAVG